MIAKDKIWPALNAAIEKVSVVRKNDPPGHFDLDLFYYCFAESILEECEAVLSVKEGGQVYSDVLMKHFGVSR